MLTLTIIMLSITGIYLNHQHNWFHKQDIHYMNPDYESMINKAIRSEKNDRKRIPEAVQEAERHGLFNIENIESINYATHGLGYFYYVHINDVKNTIVVVTEDGDIAKSYSDPLIKKWMRNLHIGRSDSINFVFINDLTTIGIIFLTVSGCILAARILKAKKKQRKKFRQI